MSTGERRAHSTLGLSTRQNKPAQMATRLNQVKRRESGGKRPRLGLRRGPQRDRPATGLVRRPRGPRARHGRPARRRSLHHKRARAANTRRRTPRRARRLARSTRRGLARARRTTRVVHAEKLASQAGHARELHPPRDPSTRERTPNCKRTNFLKKKCLFFFLNTKCF